MSVGTLVLAILASSLYTCQFASGSDGSSEGYGVQGSFALQRPEASVSSARNGRDYWERLVGTPSRLACGTQKEGVLPFAKYNLETFNVTPFQVWLREQLLQSLEPASAAAPRPVAPLSFVCGVFYNPTYKFIFIRNRKTASSTFLTAVKKFMLANQLCNVTRDTDARHPNNCIMRFEPELLAYEGHNVDAMWRDYLVITSTRNPWARAASGYQFTFEKWTEQAGGCAQPSFVEFCRDPFIMGKLSNLFGCVRGQREGVGPRHEGHWNFDFCHVEPAAPCMLDTAGKLVVDFVIRYERLDEDMQAAAQLINSRRPEGLPPIVIPPSVKWRNKGKDAVENGIQSTDAAAFVYADKFRQCGAACVDALSDFYATDLELFGWDRPGPPPP